jgi:hypothetical protein
MTVKERLLQEIEQLPDNLLVELLDVALLIKQRQDEEEISEEEKENIIQARLAYEAGDYLTLEEFETGEMLA